MNQLGISKANTSTHTTRSDLPFAAKIMQDPHVHVPHLRRLLWLWLGFYHLLLERHLADGYLNLSHETHRSKQLCQSAETKNKFFKLLL